MNTIYYLDQHLQNTNLNTRVYHYIKGEIAKPPIFTGFMNEETLNVSINHRWGNDQSAIEALFKSGSEFVTDIQRNLRSIVRLLGKDSKYSSKLTNLSNFKLYSNTDFYKSYEGTIIDYDNLEVNWYLITDTESRDIRAEFIEVLSQFVGAFTSEGVYGKMAAPNNFQISEMDFKNNISGTYQLSNKKRDITSLLCESIHVEISNIRTTTDKPLFIKSKFKFIPATMVTIDAIKNDIIK